MYLKKFSGRICFDISSANIILNANVNPDSFTYASNFLYCSSFLRSSSLRRFSSSIRLRSSSALIRSASISSGVFALDFSLAPFFEDLDLSILDLVEEKV